MRAGSAVRRHHRHQRQVDHHGADRPSPARRRPRRRSSAAISAPRSCRCEPPAPGRVHVIECSSYQIDLAPSLDPSVGVLLNVSEDHLDRHGTLAQLRGGQGAARRRRAGGRHRDRRRRRQLVPGGRRPARPAPASRWCASRCAGRSRDGHLRRGANVSCTPPAARRARSRTSAASDRCAAAQRAERRLRCRRGARARSLAGADPGRLALVSRAGAPHGGGRPQGPRALRQRLQGDQRRRRRAGAGELRPTSSGSPAASAKTGGIDTAGRVLSAHPQGLSDRRGGGRLRRHAGGQGRRTSSPARSTAPSRWPPRDAEAAASRSRSCCCRRPAPPSTSSAISRCAATRSANSSARCRGVAPVS